MNYPLGFAALGFAAGGHRDEAAIARPPRRPRRRHATTTGPRSSLGVERQLTRLRPRDHRGPAQPARQPRHAADPDDLPAATGHAVRLATLVQLTLPGAPCIYYGDEIGMAGGHDPDCRGAFPTDEAAWDHELRAYVRGPGPAAPRAARCCATARGPGRAPAGPPRPTRGATPARRWSSRSTRRRSRLARGRGPGRRRRDAGARGARGLGVARRRPGHGHRRPRLGRVPPRSRPDPAPGLRSGGAGTCAPRTPDAATVIRNESGRRPAPLAGTRTRSPARATGGCRLAGRDPSSPPPATRPRGPARPSHGHGGQDRPCPRGARTARRARRRRRGRARNRLARPPARRRGEPAGRAARDPRRAPSIAAADASLDAVVTLWTGFRGVDAGGPRGGRPRAPARRPAAGRPRLRPRRRLPPCTTRTPPSTASWSRREGPFLRGGGFKIRVVHCFWTFPTWTRRPRRAGDLRRAGARRSGPGSEAPAAELERRGLPPLAGGRGADPARTTRPPSPTTRPPSDRLTAPAPRAPATLPAMSARTQPAAAPRRPHRPDRPDHARPRHAVRSRCSAASGSSPTRASSATSSRCR